MDYLFSILYFFSQYFAEYVSAAEDTRWSNVQIIKFLPWTSANGRRCLTNLFLFPSGTNKSKESKRKEDFSFKSRSHVGPSPVTSSRFTVSPANDPHLVWFKWRLGWILSDFALITSPSPRGYFFIEWANRKTPVQEAGRIPGFTSHRILYDKDSFAPTWHYLHSSYSFPVLKASEKTARVWRSQPGAL